VFALGGTGGRRPASGVRFTRPRTQEPSNCPSATSKHWCTLKRSMPGVMKFRYDTVNDVVIGIPSWKIETREDVLEWYRQWEAYMSKFEQKKDVVVLLDDFTVATAVGPFWGEMRARVHQKFIRHNFRVNSNARVRLFVNTSGVRYDVGTLEAATAEDAIEGIKEARRIDAERPSGATKKLS
jgi:hypothetical protein